MKALGVGPIDAGILQDRNKLAIVGVPFGGAGSGSYTHGGGPVDALTGWLMPDAVKAGDAFRFRFQPERPAFDTSASHTQTTNTMTVRGQRFDAALPEGATGGFQVVTFDPIDLTPRDHKVFGTNGDPQRGYDVNGRAFMALFLDASRGLHVAVQSIGHVAPGPFEANVSSWSNLGQALAAHGANPHIFNTVDGSYAFFGGSWLERSQVEDSSSTVVIDPTADPPKREAGTLGGRLSMRDDGYWMPAVTDPTDSLQFSLYDIVFRAPTPWPYTAGGAFPQQKGCPAPGNDAAAYSAALSYIADGIGLAATFKTNLRAAYVSRDRLNWHNQHSNLLALPYQRGNGFGQAEFCNLKAQLKQEFEWLDSIKENLFDGYKDVLSRSGGQQQGNLDAIGTAVITSIDPDRSADAGWSVGAFLGNLGSALILGANPEATTILAAWEMVVTTYELARELASGEGDMPVGEQFKTKVEGLSADVASRLAAAANGLDRLRDVIISDYGRLQALGAVADDPSWNVDVPTAADSLSTAANGFFSAALLPIPYGVHALVGSPDDPEKCRDLVYGYPWAGAPASVQMEWRGGYDLDGWKNDRGRFILGRHRLKQFTPAYPPAEVSKAFRPTTQGGYGLQLSRFIWESYKAPAGKRFPPTDIAQCHS
jgi:hypothetical protein